MKEDFDGSLRRVCALGRALLSLKDNSFRRLFFLGKTKSLSKECRTMKNPSATVRNGVRPQSNVRSLSVAAMLSAVAFLLMFVEVPIPMLIPSFIKLDVSDLPALLGTFALGPAYGVAIELMKNLLHLLIKGTSSAGVGELCNFVLGSVFVFVAGVIYQRKKSRKGAILASVAGAMAMAIACVPMNYFLVYPAYVVCYGMPMEAIVGMYQAILPGNYGLLFCLTVFNLPFTLCKGLLDALLCFFIYKPLSPILHGKAAS
jgi:riboflavin transporter FmnP